MQMGYFLAQMVQDEHDKRHLQIAEPMASDHFIKELRDPEYWRSIRLPSAIKRVTTTHFLA